MTAVIPMIREDIEVAVRPRILVIDDNEILARSFARMLRNYDTVIDNDPCHAVGRIRAGERFDVILCDLRMPFMSGVEVLSAIRAHYAGRLGMPRIVMMSGSDELTEGALGAPVLMKPCAAADVRAMVAGLVETKP